MLAELIGDEAAGVLARGLDKATLHAVILQLSGATPAPPGGEPPAMRATRVRQRVGQNVIDRQMAAEIDRRMGVQREVPDAIRIDELGRLSLSHLGRVRS